MIDLVALAFHSKITNIPSMHDTSTGIKTTRPLKTLVRLRPIDRHIEVVFDTEEGSLLGKYGERCGRDNSTPSSHFGGVRHHSV